MLQKKKSPADEWGKRASEPVRVYHLHPKLNYVISLTTDIQNWPFSNHS